MSIPKKYYFSWFLQILSAIILGQTLFYKFGAAPESVYIFSKLGVESWGRVGTGILELINIFLLLIPRFVYLGGLLGFFTMSGAIILHLTILGIEVQNDKGILFLLALLVWFACGIIVFLRRKEIFLIGKYL